MNRRERVERAIKSIKGGFSLSNEEREWIYNTLWTACKDGALDKIFGLDPIPTVSRRTWEINEKYDGYLISGFRSPGSTALSPSRYSAS